MDEYVLIVDDDEDARKILGVVVRSLNVAFEAATDGLEALERTRQKIPSIILLDLLMPNMDGFTVLARLRSDPETRYIPVIVVTACTLDQINMLRLPGVKHVIQKGDLSHLRTLVREALDADETPPNDAEENRSAISLFSRPAGAVAT